ncbi:MAG: DUF2550 domain-containing protein [Actinomycetota bacterium]|nr:DUF2550 domain-containing protein [Actinomycetota bacterium]
MPGWLTWLVVLGALFLAAGALVLFYRKRLGTLTGRVGSFVCGLRPEQGHGEPVAGVAQYGVGRLDWWRTASLSPNPARTWHRSELVVETREADPLRPGRVLVRCAHRGDEFELSLSPAACAGLVSWLEAAPANTNRVW